MRESKVAKDLSDDDLVVRILNALRDHELTHEQVIALGDTRRHAASVLESLQATGLVEAYCGPIQPSTCMYRLAGGRREKER